MKVVVLIKATPDTEAGVLPETALLEEMGRFNEALVAAGVLLAGEGLLPSARGVRVQVAGARRTVVEGPFPDTEGLIAGFWIWEVKSMDEALAWVARCPNPTGAEGRFELRPAFGPEDFGEALTPELREQEARLRQEADKAR